MNAKAKTAPVSRTVEQMIAALLDREGGYVNDPRDLGGETNFGITARTARANGYVGEMRSMNRVDAENIYVRGYWVAPGFDVVATIFPAVAEELFDTGVNMGQRKAVEFLQMALNALNHGGKLYGDIAEDGDLGPATRTALRAYRDRRGPAGERVLLKALNCLQGARYIEISRQRGANEAFVYGWLDTRVEIAA